MRVCRFDDDRLGLVQGDHVLDLSAQVPAGTADGALWLLSRSPAQMQGLSRGAAGRPLDGVRLLSPIARPGKVVAAPVNYRAHVQEMLASGQAHNHTLTDIRQAGLFLKASSSVVGPSQGIVQRFLDRRTDHEVELCAVIGRHASQVKASDALAHVAGWCLGLDITVRGPEDRSFRKSIDSYCVLGPWVTSADEDVDPANVEIALAINGQQRQHANTADMVLGAAELIAFASSFYTLEPGDVLMTGTPQGVGPIRPGDTLVASGRGLGAMNTVVRAAP
jgi:2,4-didehydro-3-deoxy-L-rhamnonate hydrolase